MSSGEGGETRGVESLFRDFTQRRGQGDALQLGAALESITPHRGHRRTHRDGHLRDALVGAA